jgi:hypothetical protein
MSGRAAMPMTAEETNRNEGMGRVIRLRPRAPSPRRAEAGGMPVRPPPVGDLTPYEQTDDGDDYRHRMITNGAAFLVCVVLVVAGVWIADTMAEMRREQDCVLSGRRGCTPITVPVRSHW